MNKRELIPLSMSPIFKDIDINELNSLLSRHQPNIKRYRKGELILLQEEILDRLVIVMEGTLRAQMESPEGKIINMEEFSKGQPVAIPILFSKEQKLPVSLYSKEESEVFFLPKEMLLECCLSNKTILENSMAVMSNKVEFLSKKIKFLQLKTIKQKIATTLIRLSKKNDAMSFKLPTKEELAKEMGVTRPSLSREFMTLKKEGIISSERDIVTILDMAALKKWLD